MADVSFKQTALNGYDGAVAALQWGPDGRLYVVERFGDVKVLTVEKVNGEYAVTDIDVIDLVKGIPNHDDDGSLNTSENNRQVTGIVVGGTADDPVIYVSSSDPRIGAGSGGADKDLDTNSGIISRLTTDGSGGWEKVDIVRGLPRSEENHATNGLELSADGQTLYVAQGGHANTGAPSNNFAGQVEYAYSAAILSVDLAAIDAMDVKGDGDHPYIYDLPTLDDPDRPNDGSQGNENADGTDVSGPWGGNDGFNMAKIEADSPVQVYSPGYRNPYDVLLTEDGKLYTYDNGANNGWGGRPLDADGNVVTDPSQTATNQAHEDNPYNPKNFDNLHLVEEGSYGGHPNPIRAAGEDAGLLVSPNSGVTGSTWLQAGDPDLPTDFAEVVAETNPQEGVYQEAGFEDTALDTGKGSVNGMAEYTASVTWDDGNGGETSIKGALLATDLNGEVYIIPREGGEVQTTTGGSGQTVAEGKQIISLGGGGPLGIDAVGDGEPFAGTIWVGQLYNNQIAILEPGEGSSASPDLDGDGLDNVVDPFALDPDNGTAGSDVISGGETREFVFEAGAIPNTFGGVGFTGAMTNGEDAFVDGELYEADNIIAGGAGGVVQLKSVAEGDTYQGENAGRDNMQLGVTLDDTVGEATITLTMTNWVLQAGSSGGFPSAGLQIGTGSQDDYVKLVLGARGNADGDYASAVFEAGLENDGKAVGFKSVTDNALLSESNATWVQLRLVIDPDGASVTPQWRYGTEVPPAETADEPPFTSGAAIAVPEGSDLLAAIRGEHEVGGQASGLAVGLIATSNNGTPFTAAFDGMTISTTEKPATVATNQAEVDAAGTDGYDRVAYAGTEDIVLPGNVEEIDLAGNPADVAVTGSASDEVITGGEGTNALAGGGGADTFRGTAEGLDGDTIADLEADDRIEVTGVADGAALVSVAGAPATLGIDANGDGAADAAITLTGAPFEGATSGDFDVAVENGTMTIAYAPGPGPVIAAINAGKGGALTQEIDGESIDFSADANFTGGKTFADGGAGNGPQPVYDGTVYETERYGDFTYAIPGLDPSKEYVVELLFAEIFTDDPGVRAMDVEIEGDLVLDDLDIVGETGNADVPFTFTSEPVSVGANGTLDIAFTTVADNAKISGIVVRAADGTPPADTDGPSIASIEVTPPEAGDAEATVTVTYTDPSGVSLPSIGASDIAVTGAGTTGAVTLAGTQVADDGATLIATYAVAAPADGWTDGGYSVEVLAGEVVDEAPGANTNASSTQGFDVQTTTPEVDYVAINAGGPALSMDGFDYEADQADAPGDTFADNGGGNGQQPVFDGTVYETERNSGGGTGPRPFSYEIDVAGLESANGLYDLTLHFAELYQDAAGDRLMDVFVEGELVLDDLDIIATTGDFNTPYDYVLEGVDPGENGTIDVTFEAVTDRAAITGLLVEASDADNPTDDVALGLNIGDFSDDPDAPTAIDLTLGSNVIRATQGNEGTRDYDYVTFTVPEGQVLTAIEVDGFDDYDPTMVNSAFVAIQAGATFTEGPDDPDAANLLGGAVFGEGEVGTDILDDMADGEVAGETTIGFDAPLEAGDYTLWFSQNQRQTTATLDLVVEDEPAVGAVRLGITEGSDNVQTSNFGNNSFVLENVGGKSVASVAIDVTGALYPDTVFDPFGVAGDTVAKKLTINTDGGTGVEAPTDATATDFASPTATYVGEGGTGGFEGIVLRFDEGVNGGFEAGESVGFAVDMDPNSIAGATKSTLDAGADPAWDVGGVSGAELIGSSFTVTFTDGTTATGQVHGAGNQAGAVGIATQASSDLAATLSVGDTAAGESGIYGSDEPPIVVVDGPAGETVRVVLSMGMIQPQSNEFDGAYGDQLQGQLDALAVSDFPANNAAEFQTVDVVLTGEPQDITSLFDFSGVDAYDVPGEGTLPLAFAAAVIDPADGLPKGPVSAPVYLVHDGVVPAEPGAYLPNENGDIVFEVEDAGLGDQGGWSYETEPDQGGHEPFTGDGFYVWEGGDSFGTPGKSVLSYEFTPEESGVYYVNVRGSRVVTSTDQTEQNDVFVRVTEDGDALEARDGYKGGKEREPDYTGGTEEGWLKLYQSGGQTGQWVWANKNVDNVGIPVAYELEAGETYTFELSGRSEGYEIDRVHLEFIENPPDPAAGQTTNPVNPPEDAPLSPRAVTEDVDPPVATIVGGTGTTASDALTVEVTYSDDVALDPATIDPTDVTLTGPDSSTVFPAISVTTIPQPDGSIVATYAFDAPEGGFPAGDYGVSLPEGAVLDADGKPTAAVADTLVVAEPAEDAAARIGVNLGGNINDSTFGANTMTIANESGGGQTITSVTFNLASSLLPAMVFDPLGTAGDQLGKGFDANSGATGVGLLTADGATGSPPFGAAFGNGGYETLTIAFDDFDVGETFGFSVDIDPASIEGAQTAGSAGSVSGLELSGSSVTVAFSDGTSYSADLFADSEGTGGTPSAGGAETIVQAGLLAAPSLSIEGAALTYDPGARASAGFVADAEQTVTISAGIEAAGQTVRLLLVEADVGTDGLAEPQDAFDDLGTFGGNRAVALEHYDVVLDANGNGTALVTLGTIDANDDGRNVLMAAVVDETGEVVSRTSDKLALVVDPDLANSAVALDDVFTTEENAVLAGDLFADNGAGEDGPDPVLASVNGDATSVGSTITLLSGALLTVLADGTFSYDPNDAFDDLADGERGTDGFAYALSSGDDAAVTIEVTGTDADQIIMGTDGPDRLVGGTGNEQLFGMNGSDRLIGDAGDDVLDGGEGLDWAEYAGARRLFDVEGDPLSGGTVSSSAGTDTLTDIERLDFVDGVLAYDVDSFVAQAFRLYSTALDRAPDAFGLTGWANALEAGMTVAEAANGFVASGEFQAKYGETTDGKFVELLYANVLDRAPDEGGLAGWTDALMSGALSRAEVLAGFSESAEHVEKLRPEVEAGLWHADPEAASAARLYYAALDRAPDAEGLSDWTMALEGGGSLADAADAFVASTEFQQLYGTLDDDGFVDLLYSNVLDRDADAEGRESWVDALQSGALDRGDVLVGFSDSQEHQIKTASVILDDGVWLV